jgi:hypothetical protein
VEIDTAMSCRCGFVITVHTSGLSRGQSSLTAPLVHWHLISDVPPRYLLRVRFVQHISPHRNHVVRQITTMRRPVWQIHGPTPSAILDRCGAELRTHQGFNTATRCRTRYDKFPKVDSDRKWNHLSDCFLSQLNFLAPKPSMHYSLPSSSSSTPP